MSVRPSGFKAALERDSAPGRMVIFLAHLPIWSFSARRMPMRRHSVISTSPSRALTMSSCIA